MTDIRTLSDAELIVFLKSIHEPEFKVKQIKEWIWKKNKRSFKDMTNISLKLRDALQATYDLQEIQIVDTQLSTDETLKTVFQLKDGQFVEGVLIPSTDRLTACISSQVGCALGCQFCATAKLQFKRQLHYFEIIDQLLLINRQAEEKYGKPLNHIVYMGMGEPLLNYDQVMKSLDILISKEGWGMSPKRITISTSGIVDGILRLVSEQRKIPLALSLHAADEVKRKRLMPVTNANPLAEVRQALKLYSQATDERITIEYLLLRQINDQLRDAELLAEFCKAFPVKINIIEYNENPYSKFKRSFAKDLERFKNYLDSKNMVVNVRKSRGKDIAAACGQLANILKNS